jgi:hypothetical protein
LANDRHLRAPNEWQIFYDFQKLALKGQNVVEVHLVKNEYGAREIAGYFRTGKSEVNSFKMGKTN